MTLTLAQSQPTTTAIAPGHARFTLLGCGTSTGVPMPGCSCPVCTSTDPRNFRHRTSAYLSTAAGRGVLIDASPDLRMQAIQHHVPRVDAVLFTHAHADHILGIEDLRCFNFIQRNRIPCYGTPETMRRIKHVFDYIFCPDPSYEGGMLAQLDALEFDYGSHLTIEQLPIEVLRVDHGKMPVAAFRIGELAYITDCNFIPPETRAAIRGCRIVLLDALRYEAHRTHFTLPQAIAAAQEIGAERTIFIHMTHSIEYVKDSASLPPGIELGVDGLTFDFSLTRSETFAPKHRSP